MRRSRLAFLLVLLLALGAAPALAQDSARCVQQMLADANYPIGAVDGQIGKKTREAAALLREAYPKLELPELSVATEGAWCDVGQSQPFRDVVKLRGPIALLAWRNLAGPTERWTVNERATKCQADGLFRNGKYNPIPAELLPPFDPAMIAAVKPIFPPAAGAPACVANARPAGKSLDDVPAPIVDAETTGIYLRPADAGAGSIKVKTPDGKTENFTGDWAKFNPAYFFIGPAIASYRAAPSPESGAAIKKFLVDWATADAISVNIHVPWDEKPVDYNVLKLVPPMILAYSEVASLMTPAESETVARWLHRLVGQGLASSWGDRQDNKAYMRSSIALMWGLLIGNDKLKQVGYAAFDDALYDLRPDGSPPGESMRGGSGLHYSNRVATMLTLLGVLGAADGQDLFSHVVEGRSLSNAVNWAAVASKFPDLNLRYALPCPDAGDLPGKYDREHADVSHLYDGSFSSWAVAYLMTPNVPAETRSVLEGLLGADTVGGADIHSSGSMACYAAGLFKSLPPRTDTASTFDGFTCKFGLTGLTAGVQTDLFAYGKATIRGSKVQFDSIVWTKGLRPGGEDFSNWPLTITADNQLVGQFPLYYLKDRDDPPLRVTIDSSNSPTFADKPQGFAGFMIDKTDKWTGRFTLSLCAKG